MGFFEKLLGRTIKCPECGDPRAKASLFGTKCPNRDCGNYDRSCAKMQSPTGVHAVPQKRTRRNRQNPRTLEPCEGDFCPLPFQNPVQVEYVNRRGESRTFTAERHSLRVRHAHLSLCVAPTGQRITLRLDRIRNQPVVEEVLEAKAGPLTPHEEYILGYHRKRGTSSLLCEWIQRRAESAPPDS